MTDSTPYVANGVLVCSDGTRQTLKRWELLWLRLGLLNLRQLDAIYNCEDRRG
jgi:hypothetical protein